MTFCLRVVLLLVLVAGTLGEEGFDLSHALGDSDLTTAKPKEQTKAPEKPKSDGGLDLLDAFGGDDSTTTKPKKPSSGDTGGFGFDLGDALGPDNDPKPDKPAVKPPTSGGGGGSFSDSDLSDIGGGGEYKPDAGSSDGGHGEHPENDHHGGADQPQEAGSGTIAGIVSTIGVALAGVAGSYFAYQKKKLCFKLQGGVDPESGKAGQGTHSEPQVLSNLLRTS
ncbi:CD99 molecule isoform X1 [Hippoglossus stenolepis]|uniref:CD99 molecule isoform X1 n=1 Tax=Hippoglossus stenolepis TaxID=195615 RepID=UPI001FB0176C|nr:CD99 molecule isoform X1 [Hippoglossus stenolepis]